MSAAEARETSCFEHLPPEVGFVPQDTFPILEVHSLNNMRAKVTFFQPLITTESIIFYHNSMEFLSVEAAVDSQARLTFVMHMIKKIIWRSP